MSIKLGLRDLQHVHSALVSCHVIRTADRRGGEKRDLNEARYQTRTSIDLAERSAGRTISGRSYDLRSARHAEVDWTVQKNSTYLIDCPR